MKKFNLILVAMFAVGFLMAQNVATVTENGKNNTAYVNQLGTDNTATIDQLGDKNKADVIDHYVNNLFGLLSDAKGVTQDGNHNEGTIKQYNYNLTKEVIEGPEAGLYQKGNANKATITQIGNNSDYFQAYAWAKQTGDGNESTQSQSGFAKSHIFQQGASLAQGVTDLNTVKNIASTTQLGYGEDASIWQYGVRNNALIDQKGGNRFGNLAETTQGDGNNTIQGKDNKSTQYQNGDNNSVKTKQLSSGNTSNLYQSIFNNIATVTQQGGNDNMVNLTQTSSSGGWNTAKGAFAEIIQDGENNTLQGITGNDSMAFSLDGSSITLHQTGGYNTLSLDQSNGAKATVTQTGNNNNSVVIQH